MLRDFVKPLLLACLTLTIVISPAEKTETRGNLFRVAGAVPAEAQVHRQLKLVTIGRPTEKKEEAARKINELLLFNDRLYIGHGCAAQNTGPTDIIYYDLSSEKFVTEGSVDDEAIFKYRVLDNHLVIPGIDATEDWSYGNCYVLRKSGWQKHRSIPKALHVYDIAAFGKRWYAITHALFGYPYGTKGEPGVGMILSSVDRGASWQFEYATSCDINVDVFMKHIIEYEGKLYAFPIVQTFPNTKAFIEKRGKNRTWIYDPFGPADTIVYDGSLWGVKDLVPGPNVRSVTPFKVKGKLGLWVVSGRKTHEEARPATDHRLYEFDGTTTRGLPFRCQEVTDILSKQASVFLLIKRNDECLVAETQDLVSWKYYAIPRDIKEPRSVEYDGRYFYIGTSDGAIYKGK